MTVTWEPGFHAPSGLHADGIAYERYVGRWSRMFVPSLLEAAKVSPGDRVLDVATGTGEAAYMAQSVVGDAGVVVGTDISTAMLAAAGPQATTKPFLPVVSDGQALPFPAGSFDAVLCQLGLMFFPNPVQGLREFRRVLRRGRRAAVGVISSPDRAPMWGILAETLGRYLPEKAEELNLSFRLADAQRLEQLFLAAGFRDVGVVGETREGTVTSFDEYWAAIEAGTGQLPQAYLALPEPDRRAVRATVRSRLSHFEVSGRIVMNVEMVIGSGCA